MSGSLHPAAIVLTGGRSSRMGADKATLVVDGVRLVDRVVAAVRAARIEEIVLSGPPLPAAPQGLATVPDDPGDGSSDHRQGPLSGVVTVWRRLGDRPLVPDPVVVLACDLPRLDAATVGSLLVAAPSHRHGAAAHDGDRVQPLCAAYRPQALDEMVTAFDAGERSMRRLFDRWELGVVEVDARLVADADRPEDLAGHRVRPTPRGPRGDGPFH